jgi:hypothetical protein
VILSCILIARHDYDNYNSFSKKFSKLCDKRIFTSSLLAVLNICYYKHVLFFLLYLALCRIFSAHLFFPRFIMAVPFLKQLLISISQGRLSFDPKAASVGFVVEEMALGHVFLRVHRSSPVSIIPLMLRTIHSST